MNRFSAQMLHRAGTALAVLSLVTMLAVIGWVWRSIADQDRTQSVQAGRLATVEQGGKALATQLDSQRAQFQVCARKPQGASGCDTPVSPAAKDVAPRVANATTSVTETQLAGAVAVYLAEHPPPSGRSGTSPPPAVVAAQIRSAVTAYVSAHPPPAGPRGADSKVSGPQGGNATDAQVAAGVRAYCDANGRCRGPSGADGANGAPGAAGKDSTVPGPPGPPGESTTGATGAPGADGQTPTAMTCVNNPPSSDSWDCTVTAWRAPSAAPAKQRKTRP